MGFFPQDTSAKGLPLCTARPAVTAWLPRMELNATEAFGVCTVVRFGVLTAPWHETTAP